MKSKKEILDKKVQKWSEIDEESVFEAMDEYAKQLATGLSDYILNYAEPVSGGKWYIPLLGGKVVDTAELFSLYLNELNKK